MYINMHLNHVCENVNFKKMDKVNIFLPVKVFMFAAKINTILIYLLICILNLK